MTCKPCSEWQKTSWWKEPKTYNQTKKMNQKTCKKFGELAKKNHPTVISRNHITRNYITSVPPEQKREKQRMKQADRRLAAQGLVKRIGGGQQRIDAAVLEANYPQMPWPKSVVRMNTPKHRDQVIK